MDYQKVSVLLIKLFKSLGSYELDFRGDGGAKGYRTNPQTLVGQTGKPTGRAVAWEMWEHADRMHFCF